jgi:small subunit ribosomal protein S17
MRDVKKTKVGVVVSRKMNKTAVVAVSRRSLEKTFKKYMKHVSIFKAHDEKNECKVGDQVEISEGRPVSKEKRWRVQKILVRAESAEA